MAFNLYHAYKTDGKKTYLVEYKGFNRFYNDHQERNGYQKAVAFCKHYNLPEESIKQFDSMLESERYEYLRNLEKDGKIRDLNFHQKFTLIPEFINANNNTIPTQTYNADFVYYDILRHIYIIEDVKGRSLFEDTRFELAKALFDYRFKSKGYYISIIIRDKKEWVEWHIGDKKKSRKLIDKQKETIREQKKILHDKTLAENKIARYKERYKELRAKEKLTSVEKKRLREVEQFLREKEIILWNSLILLLAQ